MVWGTERKLSNLGSRWHQTHKNLDYEYDFKKAFGSIVIQPFQGRQAAGSSARLQNLDWKLGQQTPSAETLACLETTA